MKTININTIRIDGDTQSRVSLNDAVVAEYAQAIKDGAELPPVVVFFDGSDRWLADGFHRWHAYRSAGRASMPFDQRDGTKRDAKLFSAGANGTHGLQRTNEDKRRSVQMLLEDAEWGKWSDREIARRCAVSPDTVGRVRAERSLSDSDSEKPVERVYTTKHGTQATMKMAAGGKREPAPAQRQPAQPPKPATAKEIEAEQIADEAFEDFDPIAELEDAHKTIERMTAELHAAEADDAVAEALKWRRAYDNAVRQQSEAMDRAAASQKREKDLMRQLTRICKAIGEDDPWKVAGIIERTWRRAA